MEQLAVLSAQEYPRTRGRGIRAIVIGDQVVTATCPRSANKLASAMRGTALAVTEISRATDLNGLFNGARTEIAGGIANYARDVLRQ